MWNLIYCGITTLTLLFALEYQQISCTIYTNGINISFNQKYAKPKTKYGDLLPDAGDIAHDGIIPHPEVTDQRIRGVNECCRLVSLIHEVSNPCETVPDKKDHLWEREGRITRCNIVRLYCIWLLFTENMWKQSKRVWFLHRLGYIQRYATNWHSRYTTYKSSTMIIAQTGKTKEEEDHRKALVETMRNSTENGTKNISAGTCSQHCLD